MKHTFVLIDRLIILLKFVPSQVYSNADNQKARIIQNKIKEYVGAIRTLVKVHKTREYLGRLRSSHMTKVVNWADKVSELFDKLDLMLKYLEEDEKKMEEVLEHDPEKWLSLVGDMALGMVMSGLHDEEKEMHRFRNIAIFEMHELKK